MGLLEKYFSSQLNNIQGAKIESSQRQLSELIGLGDDGLKLQPAHCQRPLVWTHHQYNAYLLHLLTERQAGTFTLATCNDMDVRYVIDGQHRVKAITSFLNNQWPVKLSGRRSHRLYFSHFDERDQRTIKRGILANLVEVIMPTYSNAIVEQVYNATNFTGVSHDPTL